MVKQTMAGATTEGTTQPTQKRRKDTRTADGDGSLYFDAKAQLWRGELMVGYKPDPARPADPDARRRDVRKVSAKTQAECRRRLQHLRQEHATGALPRQARGDTVAGYLVRWLDANRGPLRPRTHERYRQIVCTHLVPAFARTRLRELKPDALQRLYAEKSAAGLSPRTVHHLHAVLHNALEQAVRWGEISRNVADVVAPPQVPHRELPTLTGEEVAALFASSDRNDDRLRALWVLACHTGCRQGELLGLTWDAVNLVGGELQVRRVLVRVSGQTGTFGEPKTKRSRRSVPLNDDAVGALRSHRRRQLTEKLHLGSDYAHGGLVFCTQVGTPLHRKVVLVQFKRALARAGLQQTVRFHDLRHTAATLMLANGVDIPTAAAILGHSQNSTTLNIYAHAVPSRLRGATTAIQRAIRGSG